MQLDVETCNLLRGEIKTIAAAVSDLRSADVTLALPSKASLSEARANVTIAYRHLEDASMRLGKAIQALDGGASVYDASTTVGASA